MSRITYDIPTLPAGQSLAPQEETTNTRRLYIQCPNGRKDDIVKGLYEKLKTENLNCSFIGGLNVELENSWWRLRPSYKQSALVARCSAPSRKECLQTIEHLRCRLLSFGLKLSPDIHDIWC